MALSGLSWMTCILGWYCTHPYPSTSQSSVKVSPFREQMVDLYSTLYKRGQKREKKKKKYNPIHEVKIHSTKKQYQHLASIASFSPSPPPVDLGGTAPRDVRLSLPRRATALLGLLLSSTSSLLLFFFFSLFFFHSYSSSWWLSSPPLFFFFSSPSRYNSILTHPCRIDYCFRPASTAAVQQSSSSSNPSPGLRCNYPRLALQSTTQVLPAKKKRRKVPCARPETSIICEGTEKSIPLLPLVVDHNPRLSFSLLQASVDLLRVASPWSGIENSLYYI